MDSSYNTPQMAVENPRYDGRLGVTAAPVVTRERYVELVALASETVAWLEAKGLKLGEQCEFNNIATKLWFAPKGETK